MFQILVLAIFHMNSQFSYSKLYATNQYIFVYIIKYRCHLIFPIYNRSDRQDRVGFKIE